MTSKFTPGPWTLSKSVQQSLEFAWNVNVAAIPSGNPMRLAIVPRISEEDEANANLIATAPDMRLALELILAHVEDEGAQRVGSQCTLCHTYRGMIREVLAKAEVSA